MTRDEEAQFLRLVHWQLKPWRDHPEWDDIQGEAYAQAWDAYQRAGRDHRHRLNWAVRSVRWGAMNHLRRWYGEGAAGAMRRNLLSLDEAVDAPSPAWEEAVIERIDGERLWSRVRRTCTPVQYETMWLRLGLGLDETEVMERIGASRPAVRQRLFKGLKRCRRLLGLGERVSS